MIVDDLIATSVIIVDDLLAAAVRMSVMNTPLCHHSVL
jgi:hypothetical protein